MQFENFTNRIINIINDNPTLNNVAKKNTIIISMYVVKFS